MIVDTALYLPSSYVDLYARFVAENDLASAVQEMGPDKLLAGNTIPIGWVGTAGPTTIYGSKDNNTRNGDVSHKDRFTSYER
jgi:hypothetical protein